MQNITGYLWRILCDTNTITILIGASVGYFGAKLIGFSPIIGAILSIIVIWFFVDKGPAQKAKQTEKNVPKHQYSKSKHDLPPLSFQQQHDVEKNTRDILLHLGHANVETVLHPILIDKITPTKLPLAGIALAFIFMHDEKTQSIFTSLFCKEIYENADVILSYIRGAKDDSSLSEMAKISPEAYMKRVDYLIANFNEKVDVAKSLLDNLPFDEPLGALAPLIEEEPMSIEMFSYALLYCSGAYSKEFLTAFDSEYIKQFGYLFPAEHYGPIRHYAQASRLLRDIIKEVVSEFEKGTPIEIIRFIVQERATPLIPSFIQPSEESQRIDMDAAVNPLLESKTLIETLSIIRDNPLLVSDFMYFSMPMDIRGFEYIGDIENFHALKERYGYIKNLRYALLETTPNYEDIPQRLDKLISIINNTENIEKYEEIQQAFPELLAIVATRGENFDPQNNLFDIPKEVGELVLAAEKILTNTPHQPDEKNFSKGVELYQTVLKKVDKIQVPFLWAWVSNLYVATLLDSKTNNLSNYIEEAIPLLEEVLEIMPSLGTLNIRTFEPAEILWGGTHGHLGQAYANRSKGNEQINSKMAFFHFEKALIFQDEIKHPTAWALTQQNFGSLYADSAKITREEQKKIDLLVQTVKCFSNALKVVTADQHDNWTNLSINLFQAIQELHKYGLDDDDIRQYVTQQKDKTRDDLIDVFDENKDKLQDILGKGIVKNYRKLNNVLQGNILENILSGLHSQFENMSPYEQARLLFVQGVALSHNQEGDHHKNLLQAIELFKQALDFYSQKNYSFAWASTHYNIGTAYLNLILNSQENSPLTVLLAESLGLAPSFDKTETSIVIEHYLQALEVLSPVVEPFMARQMGQRIGDLNLKAQIWDQAVKGYRIAIEADTTLYQNSLTDKRKDDEIKSSSDIDFFESGHLYPNMAFALAKMDKIEDAWKILEQGKARRLRETLGYQELDLLDDNDKDKLLSLNNKITSLQKEVENVVGQADSEKVVSIKRLEELIDKRKSLISDVQTYAPSFMHGKISPKDIVSILPHRAAIVELLITTQGAMIFVLWKSLKGESSELDVVNIKNLYLSKLRTIMRGSETTIAPWKWLGCLLRLRGDSNDSLSDEAQDFNNGRAFLGTAAAIGEVFWDKIDPVLQERSIEKVLFILQDDLALFPIHAGAISKDKDSVKGALETYQCSYSPSALTWYKARSKPLKTIDKTAILISPVNVNDFDFLHLEAWIVKNIMSSVSRSVRIVDTTVTERNEVLEIIKNANVLHYAGHAEYNWSAPSKSGLRLWRKGKQILSLEDIWSPNFLKNMNLALLSGCTTTMFDFQPGMSDEYIGLPSAFIGSGAKAVIGSLWRTDDLAAFIFSMSFYREWVTKNRKDKMSVANAVNKVQQWMRHATFDEYIDVLQGYRKQYLTEKQDNAEINEYIEQEFDNAFEELQSRSEVPFSVFDWATFQVVGDAL